MKSGELMASLFPRKTHFARGDFGVFLIPDETFNAETLRFLNDFTYFIRSSLCKRRYKNVKYCLYLNRMFIVLSQLSHDCMHLHMRVEIVSACVHYKDIF